MLMWFLKKFILEEVQYDTTHHKNVGKINKIMSIKYPSNLVFIKFSC